jgi:hypothetical protein
MTRLPWKDRSYVRGKAAKPFFEAIRSESTRLSYERRIIKFLEEQRMNIDEFVDMCKKDKD